MRFTLFRLRYHVIDCSFYIRIGETQVAALGRHGIFAFERTGQQRGGTCTQPWRPCRFVAQLRRAGNSGGMTGLAARVINGFATDGGCGFTRICSGCRDYHRRRH